MTLTETETTELDKLQLVPFTDPKLREVPQDFDFENEDAKELKYLIEQCVLILRIQMMLTALTYC